jgi:hypothetical protein
MATSEETGVEGQPDSISHARMEEKEDVVVSGAMELGQYWLELMRLSLGDHVDTSHLVPYSLPRHVGEQERLVRSDGWIQRIDPTVLSCLKRYLERCRELGMGPAGCFLQHPASTTLNLAGTRLDQFF